MENEVNIYIETSLKGPSRRRAAGMYILEYKKANGVPVTRDAVLYMERTTENILVLTLLEKALSRLTKTCSVRVNTECGHVLNVMRNHWLPQWKKNGWINAKGKPVANADLWAAVSELMGGHLVEISGGRHNCYRELMYTEIHRELGTPHTLSMEEKRDALSDRGQIYRCPDNGGEAGA